MLNSEQIHEVLQGICKEESTKNSHPSYAYEHKLKDNIPPVSGLLSPQLIL